MAYNKNKKHSKLKKVVGAIVAIIILLYFWKKLKRGKKVLPTTMGTIAAGAPMTIVEPQEASLFSAKPAPAVDIEEKYIKYKQQESVFGFNDLFPA